MSCVVLCWYCRLIDYVGPEGDEARALLRDIRRAQHGSHSTPIAPSTPGSVVGLRGGRNVFGASHSHSGTGSVDGGGEEMSVVVDSFNRSDGGLSLDDSDDVDRVCGELSMSVDE
jgi:hypothetical protein